MEIILEQKADFLKIQHKLVEVFPRTTKQNNNEFNQRTTSIRLIRPSYFQKNRFIYHQRNDLKYC